jgi:predicted ester cyclase
MSAMDIVKAGLAAVEANDFKKLEGLLADDMVFAGPVPEPVGKREFVGLQSLLLAAMPNWKFNAKDFKENGDVVTVTLQITGTHTAELSLPMPGMPKIPATGMKVSLPGEATTFTVKNGKITRLDVASTPGGGVPGILSQLGVPMPPM